VNTVEGYIAKFGAEAGPKIYHIVRSRAAYKGASTKRRHRIEALTGKPYRARRTSRPSPSQGLLPLAEPATVADAEGATV